MSFQGNIALIPLRGGSKGIPLKNIAFVGGKHLCAWVLSEAVKVKAIDDVYVSTESKKIKNVVKSFGLGIKIIDRPPQYATDEASTESVLLHAITQIDFDVLITIQATSPLLKAWHLNEAIAQFKSESFDSMLSAVRTKKFFWSDTGNPINYDPLNRPRRQDFNGSLMENGAFYITKREILEKYKSRLGGRIGIYTMPENTSIEIDDFNDLEIFNYVVKSENIK